MDTQTLHYSSHPEPFAQFKWPEIKSDKIQANVNENTVLVFKGWHLICPSYQVNDPSGRPVFFTTGEFRLLHTLASASGRVLSREYLFDRTRPSNFDIFDRAIDVQISRLRKKLGDNPRMPEFIKTIRSVGYLFLPKVHYENFK